MLFSAWSAEKWAQRYFWPKVDIREPDACWLWQGSRTGMGYGQIWTNEQDSRRLHGAHRISFFLKHGRFPLEDHDVHHTCQLRPCVNPSHLEEVQSGDHVSRHRRGAA